MNLELEVRSLIRQLNNDLVQLAELEAAGCISVEDRWVADAKRVVQDQLIEIVERCNEG